MKYYLFELILIEGCGWEWHPKLQFYGKNDEEASLFVENYIKDRDLHGRYELCKVTKEYKEEE